MFTQVISVGLLATSALATQAFSPVHNFGAMLPRDALDKRQGYYPSTSYCGKGDTCDVACGPTYEECPSSGSTLYCYDPSIKEKCCPDLSGNSCSDGYFCTSDSAKNTYCCPDGMSLSDCAASYSLTVSLYSQTAVPSSTGESSYPTTTPIHVSETKSVYPTAPTSAPAPSGNATYTGPNPPEFTGAGAKVGAVGMAVLAGLAYAL